MDNTEIHYLTYDPEEIWNEMVMAYVEAGGDTIAAAKAFKVADKVSYISTGGGAFLEFLEGKTLPAIAALQERTK